MKKVVLMAGLILFLTCQHAWASHTAMIGGARGGMGLGMETSYKFSDRLTGRFGAEGTTGEDLVVAGDNPFLIYAGLKMPLATIKDEPISWGLGFIGNYGNRTEVGEFLSVIFDKLSLLSQR